MPTLPYLSYLIILRGVLLIYELMGPPQSPKATIITTKINRFS